VVRDVSILTRPQRRYGILIDGELAGERGDLSAVVDAELAYQ